MTKVKVCHITSAHSRSDGRIFFKECRSLASNNYDVTMLVCDNLENDEINKVKIVSTNQIFKNKIHRYLKFKKSIKKHIKIIDADIYHLHDPELLFLVDYIKRRDKKIIFDSHEDYPFIFLEKKIIPWPFRLILSRVYSLFEKIQLKKVDGIITVTPHIKKRLEKINKNVVIITNYPILDKIIKKEIFKNEICFAGGIYDFWNHKNIILSISEVDNIIYKIAGKGKLSYIRKLEQVRGFEKVQLLGHLDKKEICKLYSSASIGMAICSYRPNVDFERGSYGVTKIFEYMAHGLPIICTDFKIYRKIIDKYECGYYVNPYDINDIRNKINLLIGNKKLLKHMSTNSINAARKEFNWTTQEKKLLNFYKKI